jgi:predicted esterase
MNQAFQQSDPHAGGAILMAGEPLEHARAVMVLVHGRGSSASDILSLRSEFPKEGLAYLAPQAANQTWYPYRFNVATSNNEPWLTSALDTIDQIVSQVIDQGIRTEQVILLGFSQGACLVLEYTARHPRRYGGVVGLSGGLIGADDEPRRDRGDLAGTPVLLGCSDRDFHIPVVRVHQAAAVLTALGAQVDKRIYPNLGHTINKDEVAAIQAMIERLVC